MRLRTSLIIVVFIVLLTIILTPFIEESPQYEIDKPWLKKDIIADYDFAIEKPKDSIAQEKGEIIAQTLPIFVWDSVAMLHSQTQISKALGDSTLITKQLLPILSELYQKGIYQFPHKKKNTSLFVLRISEHQEETHRFSDSYSLDSAINYTEKRINLNGLDRKQLSKVLAQHLQANYQYSDSLTQQEIQRQTEHIALYRGKIAAHSPIIRSGEILNAEKALILKSYFNDQQQHFSQSRIFVRFLSRALLVALLSGILLVYLRYNRTRIFFDAKRLILILVVIGVGVLLMALSRYIVFIFDYSQPLLFLYIVPACIVPIVISSFFDSRTSSMSNLVLALFGAVLVQQSAEYALLQVVAGTVTVYSMRLVQKRDVFFVTLAYILVAYLFTFISYHLYTYSYFGWNFYIHLILLGLNVSFTVFAYPIIFLLEKIFKVSSALSYMELTDTAHPLLHNLSLIAPGTFQHTLQVANLAKKAVSDIEGNALLTYVGALFHDIGKMKNADYFIENFGHNENPHEKLKPEESAAIVLEHVKYGVELAQKYHLPQEIIDFIQTHHGTTRVEYFYRKYTADNPITLLTESHFTYKGPKPNSKETAVVMIADSIEAASRTLRNYDDASLENLVKQIVEHKIKTEQLDNSGLTFKDIAIIKRSILTQLINIYHRRIEYPDMK